MEIKIVLSIVLGLYLIALLYSGIKASIAAKEENGLIGRAIDSMICLIVSGILIFFIFIWRA